MAIFRQRLPIPGPFDIRIGLPRDKGFDPNKARKRLEQKANPQTTINRFRSMVAGGEGLYRPAKFFVAVEFPQAIRGDIDIQREFTEYQMDASFLRSTRNTVKDRLFFFCSDASLPERTIQDTPYGGVYGPERLVGRGLEFAPITLQFMLDAELQERSIFEAWQNLIINERTFNANFYDEYIGRIFIYPLHENRLEASPSRTQFPATNAAAGPMARLSLAGYFCEMIEVYPKTIGAVELSYGASNQFAKQSITFNYRYWRSSATQHDHEMGQETGDIDGVGTIKDPKIGGIFGGLISKLPPELRRAGRDVLNQVKTRFPTGRIFGGKVFPPFF